MRSIDSEAPLLLVVIVTTVDTFLTEVLLVTTACDSESAELFCLATLASSSLCKSNTGAFRELVGSLVCGGPLL